MLYAADKVGCYGKKSFREESRPRGPFASISHTLLRKVVEAVQCKDEVPEAFESDQLQEAHCRPKHSAFKLSGGGTDKAKIYMTDLNPKGRLTYRLPHPGSIDGGGKILPDSPIGDSPHKDDKRKDFLANACSAGGKIGKIPPAPFLLQR